MSEARFSGPVSLYRKLRAQHPRRGDPRERSDRDGSAPSAPAAIRRGGSIRWPCACSKSGGTTWPGFARRAGTSSSDPARPALDFVFTVCDSAAAETCPIWPGQPMTAHWGVADPAAFEGSESDRLWLFRRTYLALERRIELFTQLPIESLSRLRLKARLDEIGKTQTSV